MQSTNGGGILAKLGEPLLSFFTFVGECSLMLFDVVRRIFRPPFELKETIQQMAFLGVASVPIVALTGFFSGAVLAFYLVGFLSRYGGTSLVGATVALSVTRELGPVLAGIMVAARAGSAMAAQIGTMAVTEQIDALRMLSVHPTNYLVVPRLVAAVVMLPVLALVCMYAAIGGAILASMGDQLSPAAFLQSMQSYVKPDDFVKGCLKTPFFGLIIAVVACQQGMRTENGAVGVGRSTTNTVVVAMVLIYIANYVLARILF